MRGWGRREGDARKRKDNIEISGKNRGFITNSQQDLRAFKKGRCPGIEGGEDESGGCHLEMWRYEARGEDIKKRV